MTEKDAYETERRREEAARDGGPAQPAAREDETAVSLARWVLREFDDYYNESRGIPDRAKQAFEGRDPGESLMLSRRRLSIYSESVHSLAPRIVERHPHLAEIESNWRSIEEAYLPLIEGRYEADLAYAFINSVQRMIYQGEWQPVEYGFGEGDRLRPDSSVQIYREFPGGAALSTETMIEILSVPDFAKDYQDKSEDAYLAAERVNAWLGATDNGQRSIRAIQMIDAGFYRNRGAYLIGRIILEGGELAPLVIALLNDENGIYVDAVLISEADSHNIFSSTLANFHVTNPYYHELAASSCPTGRSACTIRRSASITSARLPL
jgi:isocitrate dehydrogenase kinase/phosphatase